MGLTSWELYFSLLQSGRLRPSLKPKLRGRPRKIQPAPPLLIAPPPATRPDRRRTHGDTTWIVDRVDKWKIKAAGEYRRSVSDREALAHLLYEEAPPSVRRELERALRGYRQQADTKHQQRRALPKAVEDVEGERLAWWVKRLTCSPRSKSRTTTSPGFAKRWSRDSLGLPPDCVA